MGDTILKDDFIDLKDILLYSKTITNKTVISKVTYSRYCIILSNYLVMNGLYIEDREEFSDFFTLTNLDDNGNIFRIEKVTSKAQDTKNSIPCGCKLENIEGRKKLIGQDKCYYCQRIEKDYLTKIVDESEIQQY